MKTLRYKRISGNAYEIRDVMKLADAYRADDHQFKNLPYDHDKVREHVVNALATGDHFIILAYHGNKPVGGFWGYVSEMIFSPIKFGYDAFSFVLPEYRNAGAGKELVKLAEGCFRTMGAKLIQVGANSGVENNRGAIQMYQGLGYEPVGTNLMKSVR